MPFPDIGCCSGGRTCVTLKTAMLSRGICMKDPPAAHTGAQQGRWKLVVGKSEEHI